MLAFKWFSVLAFAAGAYAEAASGSVPIELKIETTYLPPGDCPVTSQKGDQIHVHYVRHLSHLRRLRVDSVLDWQAMVYWREIRLQVCMLVYLNFNSLIGEPSYDRGQPLPLKREPNLFARSVYTKLTYFVSWNRSGYPGLG